MTDTPSQGLSIESDGSAKIVFDLSLHTDTSIKKAIYKFASDLSSVLEKKSESKLIAHVHFKSEIESSEKMLLLSALCNEVIDQDLREKIFAETEATRNLILAQAFSRTNLLSGD